MFAFFLAASMAAAEPAHEAKMLDSSNFQDSKLSVENLPLEFAEGTATMALGINTKGKISACRMVDWEVGGKIDHKLEATICETLRQRARFEPAHNAAGRPVDSEVKIGADPELPEEPKLSNMASLFTSDDYPAGALRNSGQGTVAARLMVGADGRASNCTVLKSSGNSLIDARTCEIFKRRARFEPGRGPDGRALAGTSINRVRWQLPDNRPLTDMVMRTSVTFDAKGEVSGCDSFWGDSAMKKEACEVLKSAAFKTLTPVQRAFRTMIKEEGFVVGPASAVDQIGRHRGENRLLMIGALASIDPQGRVTKCETIDPAQKDGAATLCAAVKRTKFQLSDENRAKPAQTAVSYATLYLRRPGY